MGKMSKIEAMLEELNAIRMEAATELSDVTPDEFMNPADHPYWDTLRGVLVQMGNHMREHANQIEDTRRTTDQAQTMAQRMLAEAELSWGKLRGSLVGLSDEALTVRPPDGGWTIEEVLEHVTRAERRYLQLAREARRKA